jgi:hypothetical protein
VGWAVTPARSFLDAVAATSAPNPLHDREVVLRVDGEWLAAISVGDSGRGPDHVHLHSIRALTPGIGQGRRAMALLTHLADVHGVTLEGTAKRFGSRGLRQATLAAWYRRLGFKILRGGHMHRRPHAKMEAAYDTRHRVSR